MSSIFKSETHLKSKTHHTFLPSSISDAEELCLKNDKSIYFENRLNWPVAAEDEGVEKAAKGTTQQGSHLVKFYEFSTNQICNQATKQAGVQPGVFFCITKKYDKDIAFDQWI